MSLLKIKYLDFQFFLQEPCFDKYPWMRISAEVKDGRDEEGDHRRRRRSQDDQEEER